MSGEVMEWEDWGHAYAIRSAGPPDLPDEDGLSAWRNAGRALEADRYALRARCERLREENGRVRREATTLSLNAHIAGLRGWIQSGAVRGEVARTVGSAADLLERVRAALAPKAEEERP